MYFGCWFGFAHGWTDFNIVNKVLKNARNAVNFLHFFLFWHIIDLNILIGDTMKEIIGLGIKTFFKLVLVNVLCAVIVLSISIITSNAFSEDVGYMVYGMPKGEEEPKYLYSYYFENGEDTEKAKFEAEGYTELSQHPITASTKTGDIIFLTVSGILCFAALAAILYPAVWKEGSKDRNLVHFGHIAEDKLKGLKLGIVAIIPALLLFVFFIVTKGNITADFPAVWLKFLNANAYTFIDLLQNGALHLKEVPVLNLALMALTQVTVPIICFGAYILGYKEISLLDKLMYKKK